MHNIRLVKLGDDEDYELRSFNTTIFRIRKLSDHYRVENAAGITLSIQDLNLKTLEETLQSIQEIMLTIGDIRCVKVQTVT